MKKKMLRPFIYKLLGRIVTGLVLALLWDRFINIHKLYSMMDTAFFFLGFLFFALAWVNYLKLDSVKFHYLHKDKRQPGKKHKTKYMIDFIDEKPSSQDTTAPAETLDEKEETVVALIANMAAGFCFMLPSILSQVFGTPK